LKCEIFLCCQRRVSICWGLWNIYFSFHFNTCLVCFLFSSARVPPSCFLLSCTQFKRIPT
jgi:hypothetical protein